jgi:predicted nucleic acid-binding protein
MIAFDTNILIYACNKADPVRQAISSRLLHDSADGVLLWQVACEFIAASRKLAVHGFTQSEAWEYLNEYLQFLGLVLPSAGALDSARHLHLEQGLSFWDAMLIGAALDAGVARLYSEDLPGRQFREIEIINPFAAPG